MCVLTWILGIVIVIVIMMAILAGFIATSAFSLQHKVCPYYDPDYPAAMSTMADWKVIRYTGGKRDDILHMAKDFDGDGKAQDPFPDDQWTFITAMNYTEVEFMTSDNVKISASYAFGHHCAPVVVIVHGNSMCRGKFENMLPAHILWQNGFNVIAIDMRNHGKSGVVKQKGFKGVTWGAYEHLDVLAAVEWLHTKMGYPRDRIGIMGASMGGGTVTIAGGEDHRIRAVWADSPVCDIVPVVKEAVAKSYGGIFAAIAQQLTDWAFRIYPQLCDDPERCEKYRIPGKSAKTFTADQSAFYMSMTGDTTVLPSVVEKCVDYARQSNARQVDYWPLDDRTDFRTNEKREDPEKDKKNSKDTHVQGMLYYTDQYQNRLIEFFNRTATLGSLAKADACVAKHYGGRPKNAGRRLIVDEYDRVAMPRGS